MSDDETPVEETPVEDVSAEDAPPPPPPAPQDFVDPDSPQGRLDAAKRLCVEDEDEGTHAEHADDLAAAYADFARASGATGPSMLADIGVVQLSGDIAVDSGTGV